MNTIGALSGSAAGAASGAASGGSSALLSGVGADSIGGMQAGSSVLEGLAKMGAATSKAASYGIQAGEWQTQAGSEFVEGTNQATGLKSQYLNAIGGMTARMAAGGVSVNSGAAQRQAIGQEAIGTQQVDMLASDIRARRDNINVIQAQEAAKQATEAGQLGMVGAIGGAAMSLLTAGVL